MKFSFIILTLFFLFLSTFSKAQPQPIIRNLVMEGGGSKGIAYGGALLELEKRGVLQGITRTAGTSAGAIQACLLALGYTPQEIVDIITNTPVESFNDDGFVVKAAKRMVKEFGWFKGDSFLAKMEQVIYQRTGNSDLTFWQLHELATSFPFRDLYVTGCNLTEQKLVVFSYETHPNMRVADAVRVSMSIPLYYKGVWLNPEGKIIGNDQPRTNCGLFVDGGLLSNFPVEIFDHQRYLDSTNKDSTFNNQTLGLRLERCVQIDHELSQKHGLARQDITDIESYMDALTSIIMRNVKTPNPRDIERTIYINDQGFSARVRKVPEKERQQMMAAGQHGVIEFFGNQ
jgi:NTE family protein